MIGTVVGSYKVVEKIGEGGMGAVFKGVDLMLEREVAIKVLKSELARQPQLVERFRTEAVTLAKLNHPNIATLFNFFRQGEDFFMVMEFVRGTTLDEQIHRSGAMSPAYAIPLFCNALEGLEHAHRMGVIHRDIKPANMMITETGSIKIMDFGIARVLGSARMTRQGSVVGTIEYMSPEQVRGDESDARSDIYSMGILLYEMLTGRVPFASQSEYELMRAQIESPPPSPRIFSPHLSAETENAILRALAKNPAERFQSASEFRTALGGAAAQQRQAAPVVAPVPIPPPQQQQFYPGYQSGPGTPPAVFPQTPPPQAYQPNTPPGGFQQGTPPGGFPQATTPIGRPQGTPPGGFAPGTVQSGLPQATTPGGMPTQDVRETRLPGSGEPWPNLYGSPQTPKETRLPGGQPQGQVYWPQQQGFPPNTVANKSSLNWKYFAIAGAVLLVLLIVPFVVISVLKGKVDTDKPADQTQQTTTNPSPVTQNSQQTSTNTQSTNPVATPSPTDTQQTSTNPGGGTEPTEIDQSGGQNSEAARKQRQQQQQQQQQQQREAQAKREAAERDRARRRAAAEKALDQ